MIPVICKISDSTLFEGVVLVIRGVEEVLGEVVALETSWPRSRTITFWLVEVGGCCTDTAVAALAVVGAVDTCSRFPLLTTDAEGLDTITMGCCLVLV